MKRTQKTICGIAIFSLFMSMFVTIPAGVVHAKKDKTAVTLTETERLYREALQFYKDKEFEKARVKFVQVRMRDKNYKGTDSFLRRLDEQLSFIEKEKEEEAAQRARQLEKRAQKKKERSLKMDRKLQRELARQKAIQERKERQAREKEIAQKRDAARKRKALMAKKARDKRLARQQEEREKRLQEQEEKRRLEEEKRKAAAQEALKRKKEDLARKQKEQEEKLAEKRRLFEQSEKMGKVRKAYSAAVNFYKNKEFHLANYKLDDVKKMMSAENFDEKFVVSMQAQHARLIEKIALAEEKERFLAQRKKQREEDRQAAQMEKENILRKRQAEKDQHLQQRRQAAVEQQEGRGLMQKPDRAAEPQERDQGAPEPRPVISREEAADQKAQLTKELQRGVDELYHDGIDLYRAGSDELAADILSQVEKIWPNYKLTRYYLELITQKRGMDAFSQPQKASQRSRLEAVEEALDAFNP